jgi:outer membrane protein assembly factor BamB
MGDTCTMRRVVRVLVLCLVGVAVASPDASGQATSYQAGPAHAGFVRDSGVSPPLRLAWTHRLPEYMSYPLIADGRVFVTADKAHGRGWQLVALSARTGRRLWRHDFGRTASDPPAYGGDRVFVTHRPIERPRLIAFSPADGRVLWERSIGLYGGPPVASGGVVFVSAGATAAYRATDGALLWEAPSGGGEIPTVSREAVYFSWGCGLEALDRHTGRMLWEVPYGCDGGVSDVSVFHSNRLYVREGRSWPPGDVHDATSGGHVRRLRYDYAPAFAGRLGLFADAREPGEGEHLQGHTLVARALGSWRVRWRFRGDGYLDTAPLIAGGTVYVGSGSGRIYGVSLRSGRVVWRARLTRPVLGAGQGNPFSGLAAADGLLVVPAYGRLAAFR